MHAIACNTTSNPDNLSIEFDHAFVVDSVCYAFSFNASVDIDGFVRSQKVAVSNDAFAKFVQQLTSLDETLSGRAYMDSVGCITAHAGKDFSFAINNYRDYGYLVVRVSLSWSDLNSFTGGFVVEPANLSDWRREFSHILESKEPAVDFYGNWNTKLPLPKRLKDVANQND